MFTMWIKRVSQQDLVMFGHVWMLFDIYGILARMVGSLLVVTMRARNGVTRSSSTTNHVTKDSSRFRPIPQEEYKSMENLTKFRDLVIDKKRILVQKIQNKCPIANTIGINWL